MEKIADGASGLNHEKLKRIRVVSGQLLAWPDVDAIISYVTEDLSWGGPVNQKILELTAHQVDEYVLNHIPVAKQGDAFSTPAFNLPHKRLIFAVIAKWDNNFSGGERFLKLSTIKALGLAAHLGCQRIAIPALGSAGEQYPLRKGVRIMLNALNDADLSVFKTIDFVCRSPDALAAYRERFGV